MFQIMLKMTKTTKAALAKKSPRLPWPRKLQGYLGQGNSKAALAKETSRLPWPRKLQGSLGLRKLQGCLGQRNSKTTNSLRVN